MRIALVAPPWVPVPPVKYGGTEAIVDCLARGFENAGHEVLLFTTADSTCPVPRKFVFDSVDSGRLNWTEIELRHLINAYEVVQDFDIVHDHTLLGPIFSERFPDLKVVTTQHHPYDHSFRDIFRASAGRVPLVAVSESQRRSAPDLEIEKVIHHGLEPDRFRFNPDPDDYFLFLGRMSPNKGAHRAAQVARDAGVKLKIAARMSNNEGEREYFQEFVEPLLGNGVEYVGEVSAEERLSLLAGARALINPIRWPEPFGLVMIEALACGTPVLAFPEGAAPEIVEDGVTGFLCANEAEMIERIAEVDTLNRGLCRKIMEQYFCADRMVNEYLDYFTELLRRDQDDAAKFDIPVLKPSSVNLSPFKFSHAPTTIGTSAIDSRPNMKPLARPSVAKAKTNHPAQRIRRSRGQA